MSDDAPDTEPARTHLGDAGPAVAAWQRWLQGHGYSIGVVDGLHGLRTEAASLAYEAHHPAPPPPDGHGVDPAYPFVQARHYTPASRTRMDWVVLHSMECDVRPGAALGVARWFSGASAPQASAHYLVGPDAVVQGVREQDVAWGAPFANRTGIQVEQTGGAARTDWAADGDGLPVLRRSAPLVAAICRRWGIPLERVDAAGLLAGKRGITTHAAVDAAFHGSDHQDPGLAGDRRWPWDTFLALVRAAAT